jgi:biopolymer transport protein ExbD
MKLNRPSQDAEIPTSTMADIAFLLIIYFMVTATFAATRGLDFALPKDDDSPPIVEKEDSVLIEIQPDGQYVVDAKAMRLEEIFDYLKPKLEANPKKPVILRPQPNSNYGYMVDVFDTLRHIKVRTLDNGAREAKRVTSAQIREAEEQETDLGKDVNVSIPTQREIDAFWF